MSCKLIRACTVSLSVGFVRDMLPDLNKEYEVVVLSSPGVEMDEVEQSGLARCVRVEMQRHISLWKDFVSLWHLVRIMRKEKPDIVHSITPKAGLLCMMAAWLTRVPVRIHTFTGLVFPTSTGLKRRILMLTDRLTCRCATHVIPEGEGVKHDLVSNRITRKPMNVLGYGNVRGVDMVRFSQRPEVVSIANTIREKDVFTFLFVGRIVGDKGINELIEAFVRLNQNFPQTRLLLVGSYENELDPLKPATRQLIDTHPQITFAGEKDGDELVACYAASDCFVFPSYREGFPNTVLEAGAMSLPCIVTDINGSREIITDMDTHTSEHDGTIGAHASKRATVSVRSNGFVIPSKDADALFEAMKLMLTDVDMRQTMTANARHMIESRYEQGFVRQCLYDFYREIRESRQLL